MKKVTRLAFVMAIMMAVLLAACSKESPAPANNGNNKPATNQGAGNGGEQAVKPQTITVAYNQGEFSWPTYEKMAAAFKEATGHTVELKYVPAQEFENWVQTQFIGGTETDIIMGGGDNTAKREFYRNGWIVDLLPYMAEKSRFTDGAWQDSFLDGIIDSAIDKTDSSELKLYGAPDQLVTVNLYYNKDIFAEIGVTEPPATVSELLHVAQLAKDAGYIGFSIQNSLDWNLGWYASDLWGTLWKSRLAELDLNGSGDIEQNEWATAAKQGKLAEDSPELLEYARFMKDLSAYFNTGFNTASWEFEGLFNDGKAAMTLNGSWYPNQHLQGDMGVNYGIAPVPYLDKGYSSLGQDALQKVVVGGSPALSVTRAAVKDEAKLQAAIEFVQFWTAPAGGAKILADELYQIPVVKNVQVPDVLGPIMEGFGSEKRITFSANSFTAEQKDYWLKAQQQFLDNKLSAEDWMKSFIKDLNKYADQAIAANPEWNIEG